MTRLGSTGTEFQRKPIQGVSDDAVPATIVVWELMNRLVGDAGFPPWGNKLVCVGVEHIWAGYTRPRTFSPVKCAKPRFLTFN